MLLPSPMATLFGCSAAKCHGVVGLLLCQKRSTEGNLIIESKHNDAKSLQRTANEICCRFM